MRDAGLGDVVDLGLEAVVPAALHLVRLPVEPLEEDLCLDQAAEGHEEEEQAQAARMLHLSVRECFFTDLTI